LPGVGQCQQVFGVANRRPGGRCGVQGDPQEVARWYQRGRLTERLGGSDRFGRVVVRQDGPPGIPAYQVLPR